jgi:hypothetical protein
MYPDIFISYKREDVALVKVIAKELTNYGWNVWWDHNIPVGKDYDTVILDALSNARSVLVIWSEKSINSRNVKDEANVGLERGVLIPILVGNIKAPIGFRMIQALKWNQNDQVEAEELDDLIYQVKLLIGEPASKKNNLPDEKVKIKPEADLPEEIVRETEPALETKQPESTATEFDDTKKRSSKKSILIFSGIAVLAAAAAIYFYINSTPEKVLDNNTISTSNAPVSNLVLNDDTGSISIQNFDSVNKVKERDSIIAAEKEKFTKDSLDKVLERQQFIKDSLSNLPDKLILEAVFNLQQYAKNNGIKKTAVKTEIGSDSVFEFKDLSGAISIHGFLGPLIKSKKISVVVLLRPGNSGTGGIIDAAQGGKHGFYIGMQQYKPRVDIFYGSDKHAPRENFSQLSKDQWNMLLFTYSYNEINLQVNNSAMQKADSWGHDISFAGNNADFIIGGKSIYSSLPFTGLIANLLLYDRRLTDDEAAKLKELYKDGKLNKTL